MNFYETKEFFILWFMFLSSCLKIAIYKYVSNKEYNYFYLIIIPFIVFLQRRFFCVDYQQIIFPTIILISDTLFNYSIQKQFYFSKTFEVLTLIYLWKYSSHWMTLTQSKLYFPVYAMSILYGDPILEITTKYVNLEDYIYIIGLFILMTIYIIIRYFSISDLNYEFNEITKKRPYLLGLVITFYYIEGFNTYTIRMDNHLISILGDIQYGIIGMTVFFSACTSYMFRYVSWIYIMITNIVIYTIVSLDLFDIDPDYKSIFLKLCIYLIFYPGYFMMCTHQKPYSLNFIISDFLIGFCIAKLFSYYHNFIISIIFGIIHIILLYKTHLIELEEKTERERIDCDCELIIT